MSSGSHTTRTNGLPRSARSLVWSIAAGLIAVTGAGTTSGCVEDVGLIDRTAPYKLDKGMFEGVWMYMQTTIDVPYSSAVSFAGEQPFLGGTKKIVFDIQEKWLVAYPTVETIEGTEKEWKKQSIRKYWDPKNRDQFVELYVGQPVARWPIESHFDVQRSYNTFNGAQSNEVVENTSDRPWYMRDYVRISWHRQGIQDFFFSLKGGGDSYFVGEERPWDPDEFYNDPTGGYFDFVIRTVTWSLAQDRCNIYDLSQFDCAQTEVKVRHAFRRFDPRRDYEPLRYHNDEHQDRFGYFATERYAYDYDWGSTYKGTVSFANRWNLWDKSYRFDKPTDTAGAELTIDCMLDRDCDRDAGQRCQKEESWFEVGYCATPVPLPYKERGLRQIIYHLNAEWYDDYLSYAYASADSWSDTFKDAVAWLLMYEEKGIATPRACTTHAECATSDLLFDRLVTVIDEGIVCHTDAACGAGSCGADGFCAAPVTCNANTPCALGQTCAGGVCLENGSPVNERFRTSIVRSNTMVFGGDRSVLIHDNFPARIRQQLPAGHAWVRFVHLAPNAGDVGISINGVEIPGGAFSADRDLDIDDPASAGFYEAVPAGSAIEVRATSGGATLTTTLTDIVGNSQYLVIFNGTDLLSVGESFTRTTQGVRLIHAASGSPAIDLGVQGIRLGTNLAFGQSSGYQTTAGSSQRATVSWAGGRGDFSCYQAETIGVCAGWGATVTEADRFRALQIKSELPELFVLCENQFDPIAGTQTVPDADKATFYGDARYTRGTYNPCNDATRVPHPTELKKMGDSRYSFFYWVNEPQRAGPLGYGPSQADPDTGEIMVAQANIYGGAMHTYSQYAKDLIDLVNGDLTMDQVITGDWIRDYLATVDEGDVTTGSVFGALSANGHEGHFHGHELPQGFDAAPQENLTQLDMDFHRAMQLQLKVPGRVLKDYDFPELLDLQKDSGRFRLALESSLPKVDPKFFHDRLNRVSGTWIEDLLINDEIKLASRHIDPKGEMNNTDLRKALSPTTWSTKFAQRKEHERMQLLGKHCLYLGEFADDAIYGIARDFKNSGKTAEEVKKELGGRILQEVLEHEIGHTVGLRHNFSGSTDVFNFHDEYYGIREKEFILCQNDNWCDDLGGETCAIKSCQADGDCPAGTLCSANRCSAPSGAGLSTLVPTGTCALSVTTVPSCTRDRECGDTAVCHENRCYEPHAQFAPRPWMTDNEKANRRTEYEYTTVMDYMGRVNGGLHSLGKYDYAAIRFGYTQLVDTYTDTTKVDQRIARTAELYSATPAQYSFFKNAREYWPTRGTGVFHPFNYLTHYIGVEQNLDRTPRPYHHVKYQREMAINDVREFYDMQYVEVPYAYCSDEYRGNMGCYYFDMGIDMGEMAHNAVNMLNNYYIFDAFKRERLNYGSFGNPMGYYARIMDRYMRVLGDVGMYYALYDNFFFRYSWYQSWKESPLGGRTMELAAKDNFARLKDTLSSPAPGSYKFDATVGAYVNTSFNQDEPGSDFSIPFGVGRFPYTQFGSDLGYYYFQHPLWFGSFWEKLAAIVTLTDSTAYFVDTYVGEQINIGVGTSLGYNTVFADDLNNFLGGVVAGELDFYAGRNIQGRYVPPSLSGSASTSTPVVPALNNFTLKLYAALYGLAFMPAGFDPQFIDRMAVFLEGEATQFSDDPDANLTQVRFEDPIGGKVYVAYTTNYGNLGEPKVDVAAQLLLKAQDLADDWSQENDALQKARLQKELGEVREVLDVLRMLNHVYGTSTLGF